MNIVGSEALNPISTEYPSNVGGLEMIAVDGSLSPEDARFVQGVHRWEVVAALDTRSFEQYEFSVMGHTVTQAAQENHQFTTDEHEINKVVGKKSSEPVDVAQIIFNAFSFWKN